jgi:hypothetical protein
MGFAILVLIYFNSRNTEFEWWGSHGMHGGRAHARYNKWPCTYVVQKLTFQAPVTWLPRGLYMFSYIHTN